MIHEVLPKKLKVLKNVISVVLQLSLAAFIFTMFLTCFKPKTETIRWTIIILDIVLGHLLVGSIVADNIFRRKIQGWIQYSHPVFSRIFVFLVLVLMIVLAVSMFYIIFINSIKTTHEANFLNFTWFPKEGATIKAYQDILSYSDLGFSILGGLLNTVLYSLLPLTLGVFFSSLSAYGFAKLKFKGKSVIFTIMLFTMMLPGCVTLTTTYLLYDSIRWTNTILPLVVPGCFGSISIVFFLREYFMGVPDELIEAATIDGAGKLRIFFSIMLPIGRPAIITQLILVFIGFYNDYLGPLMYLKDPELYTLQVALRFFSDGTGEKNVIAAGCMFSIIPMLLIYLVLNKQITRGISISSGLKG